MYIYKFIDEYGTLIYVGITKNKNRRVSQHIKADLKRINDARYIYYSYNCDKYYIQRLEKWMIYKYKIWLERDNIIKEIEFVRELLELK